MTCDIRCEFYSCYVIKSSSASSRILNDSHTTYAVAEIMNCQMLPHQRLAKSNIRNTVWVARSIHRSAVSSRILSDSHTTYAVAEIMNCQMLPYQRLAKSDMRNAVWVARSVVDSTILC